MKKIFLFCALAASFLPASAQFTVPLYKFRTDVPVMHNGNTLANPWAGGLNCPQFSTIDLNFDNTPDMLVYDRGHNKILTFLAASTNGQWHWKYAPEYAATFPSSIYHWALALDYDADGLKDLFCYTPGGVKVFRNVSAPATGMQWQEASPRLEFGNGINLNVLASDIAAFNDIDNDGDIDVLNVESAKVSFYKNLSIENTGTPGLSPFVRQTDMWGDFRECSCNNFVFGASSSCRPAGQPSLPDASEQSRHAGNSLLALDLNGDNVKDLLWGDVTCQNLNALFNAGTASAAQMQSYSSDFPSGTLPAIFEIFPAAYFEDVTFDGKKDLLVAPNVFASALADSVVDFQESAWLYTNQNTTANPDFDFSTKSFLQGGMIDRGNGASPAFADLDADGDLDMLVGNYYGSTSLGKRATLALYTNQGTATNPVFALTNADFLNLSQHNFLNLRPVFADVNGDGKTDLALTSTKITSPFAPVIGRVRVAINSADPGQPMVLGALQELTGGITDNVEDVPCFTDVDQDGNQDLLVGTSSGALKYYRNAGSNTSPAYQLITGTFGGISADFFKSRLFPVVADADSDGFPDLITADDSGTVRIYPNYRAQGSVLSSAGNIILNDVTSARQTMFMGRYLSVAVVNLDGVGMPELVVGTRGGGLLMLQPDTVVNFVLGAPENFAFEASLFPNPAHGTVSIQSQKPVAVVLSDMLGRPVLQVSEHRNQHQINISGLPTGVYLVKLTNAQQQFTVKRLVVTR